MNPALTLETIERKMAELRNQAKKPSGIVLSEDDKLALEGWVAMICQEWGIPPEQVIRGVATGDSIFGIPVATSDDLEPGEVVLAYSLKDWRHWMEDRL